MTQLTVLVVYLVALLGLGLFASRMFRGTSRDYMLASNSIGPLLLLMSLFGTTMTAFALVGSTGEAYERGVGVYGQLASASGIVHSLCFFLVGIPLWSLGRKHGYTTQIQFFRDRLQSDLVGLLLFPVLVGMVIPYLLVGVISAGAVVQNVTIGAFERYGWFAAYEHAVPAWLAALVICLVVLTYVFFGGMRGTAWANTFQTAVFMILGVITFFMIANGLGGTQNLWENMRVASAAVDEAHRTRELIPKPIYFSFLFIPLSVAMFPHVFQHWLTARRAATFKLAIVMHPIFIMIVWLPCVLIGIWASTSLAGLPPHFNQNAVLATMVKNLASPLMGGLLSAGILAAIMSSLDSQFLCLGTMFTNDIVLHYSRKDRFTDRQAIFMARCFIVLIVTLTYVFSLFEPGAVFRIGIWCFTGFTGLFPLVVAALYWRRLTAAGAIAGIVTMITSWSVMFYRADFGAKRYAFPEGPLPLVGDLIPPLMPVVSITLFSAVAMIAVSLVTYPPDEATLNRFFSRETTPDRR